MRLALCDWTEEAGVGPMGRTVRRPDLPDVARAAALDLPGRNACLVLVQDRTTPLGRGVDLGDSAAAPPPPGVRRTLEDRLGVAVPAGRSLTEAVFEVVGPRLRPNRRGQVELWLGGQLLARVPSVRGGASYSDDFDRANSSTLGGSWTETLNNWQIASNQLTLVTDSADCIARWDADLSVDDHWCECDVTLPSSGDAGGGPMTRFASGANTAYVAHSTKFISTSAGAGYELARWSAGTWVYIAHTLAVVSGTTKTVRLDSDGSNHEVIVDAASQIGPTSDATITGNLRGGVSMWRFSNAPAIDNWLLDDGVVGAAPLNVHRTHRRHPALAGGLWVPGGR